MIAGTSWTRQAAKTLIDLMANLGHSRFIIVGHDRGARSDRLPIGSGLFGLRVRICVLGGDPTLNAFVAIDATFAVNALHWSMLAQPNGLRQRLLAADPSGFVDAALTIKDHIPLPAGQLRRSIVAPRNHRRGYWTRLAVLFPFSAIVPFSESIFNKSHLSISVCLDSSHLSRPLKRRSKS